MLEFLFISISMGILFYLGYVIDEKIDSNGLLSILLPVLWFVCWVLIFSSFSSNYEKYEAIKTETKLYTVVIDGKDTSEYYTLDENGKILINNGKEQKTIYPDKVVYGSDNKIVVTEFKVINENDFPNNILINFGKSNETTLYLSK